MPDSLFAFMLRLLLTVLSALLANPAACAGAVFAVSGLLALYALMASARQPGLTIRH